MPCRDLDALALRAQQRQPGATDALVTALLEKLRPVVAYRVLTAARGALSDADIDDVLQDVVLIIWTHDLPLFDPKRSGFLTFVNRRLAWHMSDAARRARARTGDDADDDLREAVVDAGRDPESLLAAHHRELALVAMERTLADADATAKRVMVEHDLHGATLADVARELDIHVSNACRARQRGLRFLARRLEALV